MFVIVSGILTRLVSNRWFHLTIKALVAIGFVFVLLDLIGFGTWFGRGLGLEMVWSIWWPLFPLMFLLGSRFWCNICPFSTSGELLQSLASKYRSAPRFITKNGIFFALLFFVLISIVIEVRGVEESPIGTVVLMVVILLGLATCAALWSGHVWCRYLCPLGGISSIYAKLGMVILECDKTKCLRCKDRLCYLDANSKLVCPLFEMPRALSSMSNCNLCGKCLQNCPHHAFTLKLRLPGAELWSSRVFYLEDALVTLTVFAFVVTSLVEDLIGDGIGYLTILFVSLACCFAIFMLGGWAVSKMSKKKFVPSFSLLTTCAIPLVFFGHMVHILGEHLKAPYSIYLLQPLLLILGAATSTYCLYRQRKQSNFLGGAVVILFVFALECIILYVTIQHV